MNTEKAELLTKTFPIIYRETDWNPRRDDGSLTFNFSCRDGWFDLIWEFSSQLEKIANLISPAKKRPFMTQVKEKFGGLRLYYENVPKQYLAIRSLASHLESASLNTCEICGEPGSQSADIWYIQTLCSNCEEIRIANEKRRK